MKNITVSAAILSIFLSSGIAQAFTAVIRNCTERQIVTTIKGQSYLYGFIPHKTEDIITSVEAHSNKAVNMGNFKTKTWVTAVYNCPRMFGATFDAPKEFFNLSILYMIDDRSKFPDPPGCEWIIATETQADICGHNGKYFWNFADPE